MRVSREISLGSSLHRASTDALITNTRYSDSSHEESIAYECANNNFKH